MVNKLELNEINALLNSVSDELMSNKNESLTEELCNVVDALYQKTIKGEINLTSKEIKEINKKIYEIVCSQENKGTNTDVGDKLADLGVALAKQGSTLIKTEKETERKAVLDFKEELDNIFTGFVTEETATKLVEFLETDPTLDFTTLSKQELEEIDARLVKIEKKNTEQAHVGIPEQYPVVTELLGLCKPLIGVKGRYSKNTIKGALEAIREKEEDEIQNARFQQVKDKEFGFDEFNILAKTDTVKAFEICLFAKQHYPALLRLIREDSPYFSNFNHDQVKALGVNTEEADADNSKLTFMEYLDGMLKVLHDHAALLKAVQKAHYGIDVRNITENVISQMRVKLKRLSKAAKYNKTVYPTIQRLETQFEEQVEPRSHSTKQAKGHRFQASLPSIGLSDLDDDE